MCHKNYKKLTRDKWTRPCLLRVTCHGPELPPRPNKSNVFWVNNQLKCPELAVPRLRHCLFLRPESWAQLLRHLTGTDRGWTIPRNWLNLDRNGTPVYVGVLEMEYSVHYTVYSVQCALYSVQCTVYNVQCALYT